MRILYYGHFSLPSDCENWIANALVRVGCLVYRWERKVMDYMTIDNPTDWMKLEEFCKAHNIEVLLMNKAPEIKVEWIQSLKAQGVKVVMWTFDWMVPHAGSFYPQARECDVVFMTDGTDADGKYAAEGFTRIELHQGYDPDMHDYRLGKDGHLTGDVLFLGSSYSQRRRDLISCLSNHLGDRFKHIGNRNALKDGLWGREFGQAVVSASIVIGDNYVNDIPGYWSDRVYLTLACGGFFLGSYVDGLEREFRPGTHLDVWNGFDDLLSKIDHYLPDYELRRNIAFNGNRIVIARDSYNNRIGKFLKRVKELFT